MTNPIKPNEVESKVTKPDEVIEAFNELIQKYWDGDQATFKQDEIVKLISKKMNKKPQFLFDNHYLDIEPIYIKAGWKVHYDKPGYNETYSETFTFSKSRKIN